MLSLLTVISIAFAVNIEDYLITLDTQVYLTAAPSKLASILQDAGIIPESNADDFVSEWEKIYSEWSGVVPVETTVPQVALALEELTEAAEPSALAVVDGEDNIEKYLVTSGSQLYLTIDPPRLASILNNAGIVPDSLTAGFLKQWQDVYSQWEGVVPVETTVPKVESVLEELQDTTVTMAVVNKNAKDHQDIDDFLISSGSQLYLTADATQLASIFFEAGILKESQTAKFATEWKAVYSEWSGQVPVETTDPQIESVLSHFSTLADQGTSNSALGTGANSVLSAASADEANKANFIGILAACIALGAFALL